jgi:[acyl-carrier-protein] S-malonyltransferase
LGSAWIFPGQGSQAMGMGRDLYDQFPASRAVFEEADEVLGFALSRLCFEGPAEALTATENAQPALLATSVAVLAALGWGSQAGAKEAPGLAPAFVAGHSLGEYSALVAARALSFATALRLVRRRGELMAAATEGTMAAIIGLDTDRLAAVCAEARMVGPVVIANENAPGQLVISGAGAAVARAGDLARQAGASRVMPLKVSAAFHSPLMVDAAESLREAILQAAVQPAGIPVVANVTAEPIVDAEQIRAELVRQVTAPVRWIATIQYMAGAGVDQFVELGPGTVLAGLVKRIVPGASRLSIGDAGAVQKFLNPS